MPNSKEISDKFDALRDEQTDDLTHQDFIVAAADCYNPTGFFDSFLTTKQCQDIYEEARVRFSRPRSPATYRELLNDLLGGIYNQAAFAIRYAQRANNTFVLSPEKTLDLFRFIFPKAKLIDYPFGLSNLTGVSVSDGLVRDESRRLNGSDRITETLEYTSSSKMSYIGEKKRLRRENAKTYPWLFRGVPMTVICPDNSPLRHFRSKRLTRVVPIGVFDIEDLVRFRDDLFYKYVPSRGSCTLNELQFEAQRSPI